ncbi:AraC family transcriptional regulator [Bradyrhizobium diazoefficiens]|uniref:AraC family transcriptional regulator n=1 Tax=Bradyrhizobium sp. WYCCWR 12699 TaxID=3064203 RepID=UPI001BAA6038|nr:MULTISPECIES: AraC family transcriptional regulator [Bradyrhizobium]MBR0930081.1 AraC family transcriptional regulator [Bradyrhizobium diazoefficiens]MDT4742354.1 AraC family transcriptional regulator [Bradyrhizobium sp. WYCCWR 12699]
MNRISFTSDQLPARLGDAARFAQWHEQFEALTCCVDYSRFEDCAFRAQFQFAQFSDVRVALFDGTLKRFARSASAIARGPDDDFCLLLNRGTARVQLSQFGRDAAAGPGGAFLGTNGAAAEMMVEAPGEWATVTIARDRLLQLVPRADDLMAMPLDPGQPALRHLKRYLESVLDPDEVGCDPDLDRHIGTTVLDILALTLGASRDAAEVATLRGLRAARLREILAEIRASFTNPAFSPRSLAQKIGLSPRYIQVLLQETGASFTERVLELRLQSARAALASRQHGRLKVSEIAYACGFNDISYFNQAFRRRFGALPTQLRGSP